jgi:hypothetical protein
MRTGSSERPDQPLTFLLLLTAIVVLGQGLQTNNGSFSTGAFRFTGVAFLLALTPIVLPSRVWASQLVIRRVLIVAVTAALFCEFWALLLYAPVYYGDPRSGRTETEFEALVFIAASLCGLMVIWTRARILMALLLAFTALGIWAILASPAPRIDVFLIHQESLAAIARGENPYTITFTNPYPGGGFYAPGTATAGRLLFGYVYPGFTLLVALPGYLLAHDYRYSFLAAMVLSAALAARSRSSWWAPIAAAVFLFTPRAFFVLEQGWTEPVLLLGLALTVFAASRRLQWLLPIGVGIILCAKQYSILAVPALLLLQPSFATWRAFGVILLKAVAVALVLTVPIVLWDPAAYWHNVYGMQFGQPFRPDSLSLPVFWLRKFGGEMPRLLQFGAPAVLGIATLLRAPRTPSGFAWAVGTLYFIFFMFRQGFCNYYYLVIGTYALALAAAPAAAEPPPHTSQPMARGAASSE